MDSCPSPPQKRSTCISNSWSCWRARLTRCCCSPSGRSWTGGGRFLIQMVSCCSKRRRCCLKVSPWAGMYAGSRKCIGGALPAAAGGSDSNSSSWGTGTSWGSCASISVGISVSSGCGSLGSTRGFAVEFVGWGCMSGCTESGSCGAWEGCWCCWSCCCCRETDCCGTCTGCWCSWSGSWICWSWRSGWSSGELISGSNSSKVCWLILRRSTVRTTRRWRRPASACSARCDPLTSPSSLTSRRTCCRLARRSTVPCARQ